MDDVPLEYEVAYIRYAVAHTATEQGIKCLKWKFAIEWHGYPRDPKVYGIHCIRDEVLELFFKHADPTTIKTKGRYRNGWRIYPHQSYIDWCLMNVIKIDINAHQDRLASLGPDSAPDFVAAVRSEGDELDPDRIRRILGDRSDFHMLGECHRERDSWTLRPRGPPVFGDAPKPVEANQITTSELQTLLNEILDDTDETTLDGGGTTPRSGEDADQPPATAEDGFPEHMTRIAFDASQSAYKVVLAAIGTARMRRATRLWRRADHKGLWECPICHDQQALTEAERRLATECGHFFCPECIQAHLTLVAHATCPCCRANLTICPFPAKALADPCRLLPGDRREVHPAQAALAAQKKKAKQRGKNERRKNKRLRLAREEDAAMEDATTEDAASTKTKRGGKRATRRKRAKEQRSPA